jgi:transcription initiation factor IIF auxiliary subunit
MNRTSIEIRDTAVTREANGTEIILAKKTSTNRTSYKVTIEATGNDTPFVKRITYVLHPTFRNRIKPVTRSLSNPSCSLSFYAWGTFSVEAKIEFASGEISKIRHALRFDEDIRGGNYKIVYR